MSKKYWIDKQRNAPPVIAYGVAGNYQTLTLQQTLRHLNKKDKHVAELEAENNRLCEAIETHRESFHGASGGLSDDDILWAALEVEDD